LEKNSHWGRAARQWHYVGQPLKPTPDDIQALENLAKRVRAPQPRALLLGVTREIAAMKWPEGTHLLAVDRSFDMIEFAWAGANVADAKVVCGDWCDLPLADNSRDLIVGDGCMLVFDYPASFERALQSFHRVLVPGGLLSHRFFLSPEKKESPDTVFDDLRAGRIGSFHLFKWRLAMALQPSVEEGVRLGDVWSNWHDAIPDAKRLSEKLNWPLETVTSIDFYRDSDTRFIYPTLAEVQSAVLPYFKELERHVPEYEGGERFQTILFEAL
jgi:SAM-dependent methyltransferase